MIHGGKTAMGIALITIPLVSGCGSTPAPPPAPSSAAAPVNVTDPRVSELRVQVLELLDRLEVMQSRMNRMEDVLVQLAESRPAPRSAPSAAEVTKQMPPDDVAAVRRYQSASDAADLYKEALVMYGRGQNDQARASFEQVYETDRAGELADNALFWIAETYFVMNDFEEAIRYYDRVLNEYPSQNKAADAMHRKALALVKTGDLSLARRTLESLIERYPYSTAASAAKQELERIRY